MGVEDESLRQENIRLRQIVCELHWMARRYCDGRQTYLPRGLNNTTRELLQMGVGLQKMGDGTLWARDPRGRDYDGLTEGEAAEGRSP